MSCARIARALPVILGGAGAVAGGAYARGSSPTQAAGAGLFIAAASLGLMAVLLAIARVGRAPRTGRRTTT